MSESSLGALWRRYREKLRERLASPLAVYLVATMLSRVGAFFLIPLYTRRLSKAEYGSYAIATAVLSFLPIAMSLGLTAGISKAFFDTPKDGDTRRSVGVVARGLVFVVLVMALLIAGGIHAKWADGTWSLTRRQAFVVLLAGVGLAFTVIPDIYLRSSQFAKRAAALQLVAFFTSCGLGVVFVALLGRGVDGVIEAMAISASTTGLVGLAFTFLYLRGGDVLASTRRTLRYSVPFIPHYAASWLQVTLDRWVLQALGNPDDLGPYYLALQIASPLTMIMSAFNDSESPRMGELYRSEGVLALRGRFLHYTRRYLVAGALPWIGLLLGLPLLPFVVGAKFAGAAWLVPFIGLSMVLDGPYYPSVNIVFFSGQTALIPIVTSLAALVGLGAAWLLLPRFGIAGLLAARILASLARSLIMAIAASFVAKRVAKAAAAGAQAVTEPP